MPWTSLIRWRISSLNSQILMQLQAPIWCLHRQLIHRSSNSSTITIWCSKTRCLLGNLYRCSMRCSNGSSLILTLSSVVSALAPLASAPCMRVSSTLINTSNSSNSLKLPSRPPLPPTVPLNRRISLISTVHLIRGLKMICSNKRASTQTRFRRIELKSYKRSRMLECPRISKSRWTKLLNLYHSQNHLSEFDWRPTMTKGSLLTQLNIKNHIEHR